MESKLYAAAYLYPSGAIEAGDKYLADSDACAVRVARERAHARHAALFGLHEETGRTAHGGVLVRPVVFAFNPGPDRPAPVPEAGERPAFDAAERARMAEACDARDAFEAWAEEQ